MNKRMKIILDILIVSLLVFSYTSVAFGAVSVQDKLGNVSADKNSEIASAVKTPLEAVLGAIALIAGAVAVGMLIYIGIQYMSKAAGSKADAKSTLLPYLIGAILVGSASAIASAAISMGPKS